MHKERIDYFDIAKGIAIICIVAGHMGDTIINSFVFTFHVPIFFLISGYFLSEKYSVIETARRKAVQLMVPYALVSVCIIGGKCANAILRGEVSGIRQLLRTLATWIIATSYGNGDMIQTLPAFVKNSVGAIWFFPSLFVAIMIVRYFLQFSYGFIGILTLSYIGYTTTNIIWLPMSIQSGMFAALFVYFGVLARKQHLFEQRIPKIVESGLVGVWLFCILYCGHFYMVRNYAEYGFLDIIGALAGSYLVILASRWISTGMHVISEILRFYGRNSLLILCIHAFDMQILSWQWLWRVLEKGKITGTSAICFVILAKVLLYTAVVWLICVTKWYCERCIGLSVTRLCMRIKGEGDRCLADVTSGRLRYWDIAKGIAIILCVLGNCEGLPSWLRVIIFSFHMPLFFIANGYFLKSYDIRYTFKRSCKTLLGPYIATCLASAVIYTFIAHTGQSKISLFSSKLIVMFGGMSKASTRFISFGSVWLVWFVCCLFVARNLYVVIMDLMKNYSDTARSTVILMTAIFGYLLGKYYAFMPWSLDVAMVSLIFIGFADWMKRNKFMEQGYFCTLVIPLAVWIYCLHLGIHIELATRSYPLGFLSIIEAIAGSLVVISVSKLLGMTKYISVFLAWCGRNSMIVLILHCLEMMYFDWNKYLYSYLPFEMNWLFIFIIKISCILTGTLLYDRIRKCNSERRR